MLIMRQTLKNKIPNAQFKCSWHGICIHAVKSNMKLHCSNIRASF